MPSVLRFITVGLIATVTHVLGALVFNSAFAVPPLAANLFGFLLATGVSYGGHWLWTFGAASAHRHAMPRFIVLSVSCFCLSQFIVYVVTRLAGLPLWVAMIPVLLLLPPFSFLVSRAHVFLPRPDRR